MNTKQKTTVVVNNIVTTKPCKERVIENFLPYKEITIKTKLPDGKKVEGKSITVKDTVTFQQLKSILTEKEMVEFIRLSLNVTINNYDRNKLRPQVTNVDKIKKLVDKGLSQEEKQQLLLLLQ